MWEQIQLYGLYVVMMVGIGICAFRWSKPRPSDPTWTRKTFDDTDGL